MAVSLLSHEVSDLCIGKPALKSLPLSATAGDALLALKKGGDTCLAVSAVDRSSPERNVIAGKLCVVDILCFLCADENLDSPVDALKKPVSVLLSKDAGLVRRVEPHSSVLEALDVILEGAPCLVVPIRSGGRRKLHHYSAGGGGGGGVEFCWLTQEDFVRYFFSSIAHFAPIAAHSVSSLGLVRSDILAIQYDDAALNALPLIRRALTDQTSVAVITDDGKLVGEISPSTLAACDETVAAVLVTLSVGDLMAYIDYCGLPPEAIKARLKEKGLNGMLELIEEEVFSPFSSSFSSSSSDDEESAGRKLRRLRSVGMRRSSEEAIVCQSESSLVAVMVQALAHRVNYVWVVDEEDYRLLGIVTFADVLKVFRGQPFGI